MRLNEDSEIPDRAIEAAAAAIETLSLEKNIEGIENQVPIDAFCVKEFRDRHGGGASVEVRNEELRIRAFNDARASFSAWILRPLSKPKPIHGGRQEWLFLVIPPPYDTAFPKIGESCELGVDKAVVVDGKRVTTGFMPATRMENPLEGCGSIYSEYAAFKVLPPMGKGLAELVPKVLGQLSAVASHAELGYESLHPENSVNVVLRLTLILTSYLAEMSALNYLSEPKRNDECGPHLHSREAFTWMLDFTQKPPSSVNLFDLLPHMRDPLNSDLPEKLVEKFRELNENHLAAYYGLGNVPARLHMVSGCPGAGKTHWNLLVAAIAQARPALRTEDTGEGRRRAKVLYLIDVNKPVDDVADRMFRLYRATGLKGKVVRMYGWPYELRQSQYIEAGSVSGVKSEESRVDFTSQFVTIARNAELSSKNSQNRAPTLDQAAWKHFRKHRDGQYASLAGVLDKLLEEGTQTPREAQSLRRCVYRLYEDVLKEVDFIATTPVSSYGNFPQMFRPDLIFVDEAPHARELTSLIPIAFFSPIVWIFTGDFRQTRPFVASPGNEVDKLISNPFGKQLTISTMERAARVGALTHNLFINHRCYGNLERLASKLFYGERMRSGIPDDKRHPPTQVHVHEYMDRLVGHHCVEPRVLIHMANAQEALEGRSYYNPTHQAWIMARVKELLADENFRRVDGTADPGSIMIIAPYQASITQYKGLVSRGLTQSVQSRVDIRTVDTAQGHEADVVFLDMVRTRTPGFMDDAHRLCVAITRARQAEFIVMNPRMLRRMVDGRLRETKYLYPMWRDVFDKGQYFRVE